MAHTGTIQIKVGPTTTTLTTINIPKNIDRLCTISHFTVKFEFFKSISELGQYIKPQTLWDYNNSLTPTLYTLAASQLDLSKVQLLQQTKK